jgi:hypothetical protein
VVVGVANDIEAHPLQLVSTPGLADHIHVPAFGRWINMSCVMKDHLAIAPGAISTPQEFNEIQELSVRALGDLASDDAVSHGSHRDSVRARKHRVRYQLRGTGSCNSPSHMLKELPSLHYTPLPIGDASITRSS